MKGYKTVEGMIFIKHYDIKSDFRSFYAFKDNKKEQNVLEIITTSYGRG